VYETLGKLVARGAAIEVPSGNNGTAYVALPAEALIGRLRRETSSTIEGLERVLPAISAGPQARVVQHLQGRERLLGRAVDVIDSAERMLWLSIWPEEAEALVAAVDDAIGRGVDVSVISYGDPGSLGGKVYRHDYSAPEVVLERLGCRISIVVADHDQVMIAGITEQDSWGMWSDDRAVTLVAAEHVRHDIALQIIGERLRAAGMDDVWSTDPQLDRLREAAAADVRSQLAGHTRERGHDEA
jgi:sugar-specific transcriptional regulator TrmB